MSSHVRLPMKCVLGTLIVVFCFSSGIRNTEAADSSESMIEESARLLRFAELNLTKLPLETSKALSVIDQYILLMNPSVARDRYKAFAQDSLKLRTELSRYYLAKEMLELAIIEAEKGMLLYKIGTLQDVLIPLSDYSDEIIVSSHTLKHKPFRVAYLRRMGKLSFELEFFNEASKYYVSAFTLSRELGGLHSELVLLVLDELLGVVVKLNLKDDVLLYANEIVNRRQEWLGPDNLDTLISMVNLGIFYKAQGRNEKAIAWFDQTLTIGRKSLTREHKLIYICLNQLSDLYWAQGKYDKALPLAEEKLPIERRRFGDKDTQIVNGVRILAELYMRLGRYSDAKKYFQELLSIQKDMNSKNDAELFHAKSELAFLYELEGDYKNASLLLEELVLASNLFNGPDHIDTLRYKNGLASVYRGQGLSLKSKNLFEDTIASYRKNYRIDLPDAVTCLENLAGLHMETDGTIQKAEEYFKEVLKISRRIYGSDDERTINTIVSLASLYWKYHRYEIAQHYFVEAVKRSKKLSAENPITLRLKNNLAVFYNSTERVEEGEALLQEVITAHSKALSDGSPKSLATISNLVEVFALKDQFHEGLPYVLKLMSGTADWIETQMWGVNESIRASYVARQRKTDDFVRYFFTKVKNTKSAKLALQLSLDRKAILLRVATQIQTAEKNLEHPQLGDLSKSLLNNRRKLASMFSQAKYDSKVIKSLRDKIEQEQAQLGLQIKKFGLASRKIEVDEVLSVLKPNETLVDYAIYMPWDAYNRPLEARMLAIVARGSAVKNGPAEISVIELGEYQDIASAIGRFRNALMFRQDSPDGRFLTKRVWTPLLEALGDSKSVYVVPDGTLNLLPFSALPYGTDSYILEEYDIRLLSSGRDLIDVEESIEKYAPVVISAPIYSYEPTYENSGELQPLNLTPESGRKSESTNSITLAQTLKQLHFDPLPGALLEGQWLYKELSSRYEEVEFYDLERATESAVANVISPDILHIATHGYYLSDLQLAKDEERNLHRGLTPVPHKSNTDVNFQESRPVNSAGNPLLRSGLAFVGANDATQNQANEFSGLLSAQEVLDLDLAGTQLVVLSACDTGTGEIRSSEGVYGLRRAFQQAGAQNVMSTLWAIHDEGTVAFMKRFYSHYLASHSAQESLRYAQKTMLSSERWSHPTYWAPFTLVGR